MALKGTSIAVVGCGAMGEAMVKGLLRGEFVEPAQITASHPRRERCGELEQRYGSLIRGTLSGAKERRAAPEKKVRRSGRSN